MTVLAKPYFWIPKFEPWRLIRPLLSGGGLQSIGDGIVGSHESSLAGIEGGVSGIHEMPSSVPITFVASGAFVSGTSTVAPGLPSGWAADDLHVLVVESAGGDGDPGAISGWSEDSPNGVYNTGGGTDRAGITVYYRVAVGGDSAPTVPDTGNHTSARIHGFRNVDTTTPLDQTSVGTSANDNSTSISASGITTQTDGAMVVWCVAHGDDGASWTNPSNISVASLTDVYNTHTDGNDGSQHIAYGIMETAGGTGNLTGVIDVSEHVAAITIALRPASP